METVQRRIKKTTIIIGSIVAIIFTIFLLILIQYGEKKKDYELNSNYQVICKDSSFIGIVEYTAEYTNRSPKGGLYIDLMDGKKIVAPATSYVEILDSNNNLTLYRLRKLLTQGDTIHKPANIDSLIVFKSGKKYSFYYPSETMIENSKRYGGIK